MSITNALQTGVSGLQANSSAVSLVSENIANANTDGYHRSFASMVTQTTTGTTEAGSASGVYAVETSSVGTSGSLRITNSPTDLAISGSGFFVVSVNPNETLQTNYQLTRAGSFLPDENGDLVNSAGLYLAGYPYDENGNLGAVDTTTFGDLQTVNISDATIQGTPTTAMDLSGNLPSQETGLATPGDPFVSSAEFFSPLGESERLQFNWQPSSIDNTWTVTIADSTGAQYGSVDVTFHDSGELAGAPLSYSNVTSLATAPAEFTFDTATGAATLTIDNGTEPQVITVGLGAPDTHDGMTQFAGDYSPLSIDSDGSGSAYVVRTEIDENGDLYGVYDDGTRKALFNIPVAEVPNPEGLKAVNGNAYILTDASGDLSLGKAGLNGSGKIVTGALEGSNVDIAQELTDLIKIQRAYSSNAKIVTTADEMLDETLRLKR